MKKVLITAGFAFLIGATAIANLNVENANSELLVIKHDDLVTKTFKVYGNCGMCKKRIEGSLSGVKGIEKAIWNSETKMLEVAFHEHDITLDEIKKKIASVGYDTDEHRASNEVYEKLPGCCQYERPETK